jgi:hypothetical protein
MLKVALADSECWRCKYRQRMTDLVHYAKKQMKVLMNNNCEL